ncbi:MAG TPA: hydroxymethylbilane synthase [Candidatus Saccharimonadales bacterium]|nr:hydroxymethylbilane synthase [Candidatus Saccharimonadales bacterium]
MSSSSPIRIATRGSALALAQARLILAQCQAALPGQAFELRIIKTTGDRMQTASLAAGLTKGLFTKEIEDTLLRGEADLAVHSLKDLPTELPAGLRLGAVTRRADPRDVLVYRDLDHLIREVDPRRPARQEMRGYRPALTVGGLPGRATVATSSTRRAAQLRECRPDLCLVEIRGNVDTRLRKVAEDAGVDATVLAAAGLERLNFRIASSGLLVGEGVPAGLAATPIPFALMLPCAGQAAIGVEVRENNPGLEPICAALDHAETHQCVAAERAFLQGMGGGCHLAVAAYGQMAGPELHLSGVSFLAGAPRRGEVRGPSDQAHALGLELARQLQDG